VNSDFKTISLISAAHGLSHFSALLFPPLFPYMKDELGVSYAALGFMAAVFYAFSAIFQPVAGFVVDRYGPRAVLLGGIGLLAGGVLIGGLFPSYAGLVVGSGVAGLGNSVFHPADYAIMNSRVSAQRLPYAFSAHGVVGYLGFAAAPIFGASLAPWLGWKATLLAGAGVGFAVLAVLLLNAASLKVERQAPPKQSAPFAEQMGVIFSTPVVMCFLYFTLFACGLVGLQTFGVSAMAAQYGVSAALASGALTSYLIGSACGIVVGGYTASRIKPEHVAGGGMTVKATMVLLIATAALPPMFLPVLMAIAGFSAGVVAPSRDLLVRSATPPGAMGRVYGFVYSGLDVGSLLTPVLYGWLMDHSLPHGVFYLACGFTVLAIFTVLSLPARQPVTARS
jgi:FSR family fosmidomycin resistance protein-like MFS transporter